MKLFRGAQDIAHVISVNHFSHIYTILAPYEEYAHCNCAWADQGHICNHAVKVYKMIHPEVKDTIIIRCRGSLHGTSVARYDIAALALEICYLKIVWNRCRCCL
jgi:hypothetical protein